jgi:hypothetical protein
MYARNGMPERNMLTWLNDLHEICENHDIGRLVLPLKYIFLNYSP